MNARQGETEFSRLVGVDDVGVRGKIVEIEAGAAERQALARRLALISLERLTAKAALAREGEGGATGLRVNFTADVVQSCVVTLDPVPARIEDSFELVFVPEDEAPADRIEVVVTEDEDDPPEALREGRIDVGEAIAEHLALALDPYPRRPGVSAEEVLAEAGVAGKDAEGPFDALRRLKEGA
jgi:uncharacterized metal-binding protein YceD (DUF177 family)